MPAHPTRLAVEIPLLFLLSFLWGGSYVLVAIALETIPPATLVFSRLFIGASLLALAVRWQNIALPTSAKRWGALLVQGILQSAIPFTLISWGQKSIDSAVAGMLNSTTPLFVFLLGYFLLRDRQAGTRQFIGVMVGLAGVLVILAPGMQNNADNAILGQMAVIGASLSYAIAALNAKRFADQPPLLTAACSMGFAALIMLPGSILFDAPALLNAPAELAPTLRSILAVIGLGVFSTAIAMALYFRLVGTLGPLGVASGGYIRAGFSVVLGGLILGEAFTMVLALGLLMIFAGVAIVTKPSKKPT